MPDHRHAELSKWLHSQVTGLGSEDPEKYGRMIPFAKIRETATAIDSLHAEIARLREGLLDERTDNLVNIFNSGKIKDGKWTHLFMSEGEWLVGECGLDPRLGFYDADALSEAIPIAARKALEAHND